MQAAVMPLPSEEVTPPVTKTYFATGRDPPGVFPMLPDHGRWRQPGGPLGGLRFGFESRRAGRVRRGHRRPGRDAMPPANSAARVFRGGLPGTRPRPEHRPMSPPMPPQHAGGVIDGARRPPAGRRGCVGASCGRARPSGHMAAPRRGSGRRWGCRATAACDAAGKPTGHRRLQSGFDSRRRASGTQRGANSWHEDPTGAGPGGGHARAPRRRGAGRGARAVGRPARQRVAGDRHVIEDPGLSRAIGATLGGPGETDWYRMDLRAGDATRRRGHGARCRGRHRHVVRAAGTGAAGARIRRCGRARDGRRRGRCDRARGHRRGARGPRGARVHRLGRDPDDRAGRRDLLDRRPRGRGRRDRQVRARARRAGGVRARDDRRHGRSRRLLQRPVAAEPGVPPPSVGDGGAITMAAVIFGGLGVALLAVVVGLAAVRRRRPLP